MVSDRVVINLDQRARKSGDGTPPGDGSAPSEDAIASAFVARFGHEYRYVAPWHRWIKWDGKRWVHDATGNVFALIRKIVHESVGDTRHERKIATAGYIAGVERLARYDQSIVVLPADMDADPWLLNTQAGIVDLRTGVLRDHDPEALMTRLTGASPDALQGNELWALFLKGITQDDGERHPTEWAQFMGVRLALCSEPSSSAIWNDSRVKSLTGDATISARFMRGDNFTFPRTHKTIVVGNHMPKLNAVTHAIRRRIQMVPFRAVFEAVPGLGMRERLKQEALGAVLAWAIAGTALWQQRGTAPPEGVRLLTDDYLADEDGFGQWLSECCVRDGRGLERSSELHRNYAAWCDKNGSKPESNAMLSRYLVASGFTREKTMIGR